MNKKMLAIVFLLCAIVVAMLFGTLSNYSMSFEHEVAIEPDVPTPTITPITAIGNIGGTAQVGQALTAGSLSPSGATVVYQWQKCATPDGTYENISKATSSTYTLDRDDYNYYLKVVATGTDGYSGTVTSAYKGPVTAAPLTGIEAISGTAQVGETLTAGALTPSGATVTYQWQRCATQNGTYVNISGATGSTYTLAGSDYNYYIKVIATGSGSYSGTVASAYKGPVAAAPLTGIEAISGTPQVGQKLTAGALSPSGATVTYQWQRCATQGGTYANISGATGSTYTLTSSDYNYYIKVKVTGTNGYSGTALSDPIGLVTKPLTGIGTISGTAKVGQTLTAGSLSPTGATATYQWQRCATQDGTYEDISGATSNIYKLMGDDYNYYFKVVATGTGGYSGTITSAYKGPVAAASITSIGSISGTARVGQTLTAGAVTPSGATVTYQWQKSSKTYGPYVDISDATESTYTLVGADYNYYIRVVVTGTGGYTGTVTSSRTSKVSAAPITGIDSIIGTAQVGETLTAGAVTPEGATVTYQWKRCLTESGTYVNISGATDSTYILTSSDNNYYIKVVVTGTNGYSGTATSTFVGPVAS